MSRNRRHAWPRDRKRVRADGPLCEQILAMETRYIEWNLRVSPVIVHRELYDALLLPRPAAEQWVIRNPERLLHPYDTQSYGEDIRFSAFPLPTRQSLVAKWVYLIRYLQASVERVAPELSDFHADEVVDSTTETSEDVHGGEETAEDIPDSPSQGGSQGEPSGSAGEHGQDVPDSSDGRKSQSESHAKVTGTSGQSQSGREHSESQGEPYPEPSEDSSAGEMSQTIVDKDADGHTKKSDPQFLQDYLASHTPREVTGGHSLSGDERQHALDPALFYGIRSVIRRLADDPDPLESEDGDESWDVRKLVAARWNPLALPSARTQPVVMSRNIYLIVDDSASVREQAHVFASLAAGAVNLIRVFAGSEAHPNEEWALRSPLHNPQQIPEWKTIWEQKYQYFFEDNVAHWLRYVHPEPGARLLFWGDALDINVCDSSALQRLLRLYRPLWLMSHNGHNPYRGYEGRSLELSMPVRYNVDSGSRLLAALRHL